MANVISVPAVQRAAGTYNLPSTKLPNAADTITIAIDRTNLGALVGPVAKINIEGSEDNVNWVGLGGCTLDGGVAIKRDGTIATESFYTVEFQENGVTVPFPDTYRVRGTVILFQTCTCSAVVRII